MRSFLFIPTLLFLASSCDVFKPDDGLNIDLPSTRLLENERFSTWLWSADGTELYYMYDITWINDPPSAIQAVNVTSGEKRLIVPPPDDHNISGRSLARSHSGDHLVYSTYSNQEVRLNMAPVTGTSAPRVISTSEGYRTFAFSPDLTRVAVSESDLGVNEIRIIDIENQSETVVTAAADIIDKIISWSPDGSAILVASVCSSVTGTEFSLFDLATSTYTSTQIPCFGPDDGIQLNWELIWQDSQPEIGILHPDGIFASFNIQSGEQQNRANNLVDLGPEAAASWSPNGQAIAYWKRECTKEEFREERLWIPAGYICTRANHQLNYLSLESGISHRIASFETESMPIGFESGLPQFSPDGHKIAFQFEESIYITEVP